jgi:hypothetical protein
MERRAPLRALWIRIRRARTSRKLEGHLGNLSQSLESRIILVFCTVYVLSAPLKMD